MGLLDLLGFGAKSETIKQFSERGAIIIDVRTVGEFQQGHIKNAKNIPLDILSSKIEDIKKMKKPVLVCCQSGMRSSQAAGILKRNNIEVINGGGWQSLENKI